MPDIEVDIIEVETFGVIVADVQFPPPIPAVDVTVVAPGPVTIDITELTAQGPPGPEGPEGPQGVQGETGTGVIGGSITVGPTPPANPNTNDVWIDTT